MTGDNIVLYAVLVGIVLINGLFAYKFIVDYWKHRDEARKEPGNPIIMSISSTFLYFCSTLGISDFALSTSFYRAMKWVDDRKLPGTLNTQCVIAVAVMALAYIQSIQVDVLTLVLCIASQTLGSYLLPRYVVKLPIGLIRKLMGFGLFIATGFIIIGKLGYFPVGGELTGLRGIKLIVTVLLFAVFGAMNTVGIGSYPFTMVTIYAMGLNPAVAFPIMMGACTFSVPVGSMEYVRLGQYGRKITLFSSTFGIIGVLIAVKLVSSLNIANLQWLVAGILVYSGTVLLYGEFKRNKGGASA